MDGKIIIGTEIDDKQLNKDLKDQKKILKQYEKEAQELMELKEKYEPDVQAHEKQQEELKKTRKEYEELNKKIKELEETRNKIYSLPESEAKQALAENPNLNKEYFELLKKRSELNKEIFKATSNNNQETEKNKELLDDVNNKLKENLKKQHEINQNINNIEATISKGKINDSIKQITEDTSKGISKIIKKVVKWGLAVFSIRSAYMAVRNAINVISQNDEQLKADIDYIRTVLAYTLEPVVRKIVEWMKQLVFYIGYIIKMWTGYDIFASANKALKKTIGGAKELKKQLAGFDEMNILSDSDSSGGGSGVLPNLNFENMKIPKWLEWIGKNPKKTLLFLSGIYLWFKKIKLLGIGIAIYGIYQTIKSIIDFAKDPTFKNFINIIEGIALTIIGIGIALGSIPTIVAGVIVLIISYLVNNFEKIKEKFKQLNQWLDENVLGWLKDNFGKVGEFLYIPIKVAIKIVEDLFDGFIGGLKKIIEGIVKIFKGDFVGGIKDIFSGLLSIILAPFRAWYDAVSGWIYGILDLFGLVEKKKGNTSFGYGGSMGGRAKGGIYYPSKLPRLAVGGIINQPGRGVPYHGAYIGERGAEAVVPLTDSQQMALLGETIGRYVNINATVPVYVGNRLVIREMKRINAEDNFAYNR